MSNKQTTCFGNKIYLVNKDLTEITSMNRHAVEHTVLLNFFDDFNKSKIVHDSNCTHGLNWINVKFI